MIAELPVLDATRCTGRAECVAVCPTACLAMDGSRPWLPRPLDCVSCALCVQVCPTEALRMSALEEDNEPRPSGSEAKSAS